jgi:hypothetical protein
MPYSSLSLVAHYRRRRRHHRCQSLAPSLVALVAFAVTRRRRQCRAPPPLHPSKVDVPFDRNPATTGYPTKLG